MFWSIKIEWKKDFYDFKVGRSLRYMKLETNSISSPNIIITENEKENLAQRLFIKNDTN